MCDECDKTPNEDPMSEENDKVSGLGKGIGIGVAAGFLIAFIILSIVCLVKKVCMQDPQNMTNGVSMEGRQTDSTPAEGLDYENYEDLKIYEN